METRKKELEALLAKLVCSIVDNPDQVQVSIAQGPQTCVFNIRVAKADLGKVLGRQGSMALAIRKIVYSIATKHGFRAVVEILE